MIEKQGDGEDEEYRFTPEGLQAAIEAYEMFKEGYSHMEISDHLGLAGGTDEQKTQNIQVLLSMAELTGAIEGWEEFKELDKRLEEVYDEETDR